MAKYNYSKYTIRRYDNNMDNWYWEDQGTSSEQNNLVFNASLSMDNARFVGIGSGTLTPMSPQNATIYGFASDGSLGHKYVKLHAPIPNNTWLEYRLFVVRISGVPSTVAQGNFIQNVVAEDGTYPTNGRHTDDFWYVRGTIANTAPITPGTFTQPTGTLEIGDSKAITWGASSDAEGNISRYILEASVNNGAWSQIGQPTSPSFTYTVPTATSVKFRVKAVDSAGLESTYRESSLFTVAKPMYYWSKYTTSSTTLYKDDAPFEFISSFIADRWSSNTHRYTFDPTSNRYSLADPWGVGEEVPEGAIGYWMRPSDGALIQFRATRTSANGLDVRTDDYAKHPSKNSKVTTDSQGYLVQSNITAIEGAYPTNGKHTDGFWYVRGSRVSQSIAPPGAFTTPAQNAVLSPRQAINLAFGSSSAPSISTYEVQNRYNEGAWSDVGAHTNSLTRQFAVTDNKTLTKAEFRVRAKNTSNVYSDYVYSEIFTVQHNALPTLTLNTADNQTLYENSTLNIGGTAIDADIGNVVSVKFKVNNGISRTIDAKVMDGTALSFDRTLTFKQGILYDGATAITGVLVEGIPNTVTVWSEDDQGGKSADVTRAFLVVSNRAPALLVNPIATKSNLINKDVIIIGGSVTDPENDNVTVSYKLNGGASVQVYSGAPGVWTFDLLLKNLQKGDNAVVIDAVDSYDAKATKTLKVSKTHNAVPLKKASAMWKINSATTTTKEVLAWIQREIGDLVIDAEISMTNAGEQENFVPMDLTNTAPVGDTVIEDEFDYLAPVAKENIVLKLNLSRTDTSSQKAIKLISGVLE